LNNFVIIVADLGFVASSNDKLTRNVIASDCQTCRPVEESIIITLLVVSIETTAVDTVSLTSRIECPIIFTRAAQSMWLAFTD